jgi:hypothetical protein
MTLPLGTVPVMGVVTPTEVGRVVNAVTACWAAARL